jgi:hypothetical protein
MTEATLHIRGTAVDVSITETFEHRGRTYHKIEGINRCITDKYHDGQPIVPAERLDGGGTGTAT